MVPQTGVPIFVEHWGDNLQFYPNFALFSTLGGMSLDQDFFQVSKKKRKKRSSPKMEPFFPQIQMNSKKKVLHQKWSTFFSPNSDENQKKKKVFIKKGTLFFPEFKGRPALRRTPESNYWGDADIDHTQIIGGIQSNYWGGYSQIIGGYIPPGFGTPDHSSCYQTFTKNLDQLKHNLEVDEEASTSQSPRKLLKLSLEMFPPECMFCDKLEVKVCGKTK